MLSARQGDVAISANGVLLRPTKLYISANHCCVTKEWYKYYKIKSLSKRIKNKLTSLNRQREQLASYNGRAPPSNSHPVPRVPLNLQWQNSYNIMAYFAVSYSSRRLNREFFQVAACSGSLFRCFFASSSWHATASSFVLVQLNCIDNNDELVSGSL